MLNLHHKDVDGLEQSSGYVKTTCKFNSRLVLNQVAKKDHYTVKKINIEEECRNTSLGALLMSPCVSIVVASPDL